MHVHLDRSSQGAIATFFLRTRCRLQMQAFKNARVLFGAFIFLTLSAYMLQCTGNGQTRALHLLQPAMASCARMDLWQLPRATMPNEAHLSWNSLSEDRPMH